MLLIVPARQPNLVESVAPLIHCVGAELSSNVQRKMARRSSSTRGSKAQKRRGRGQDDVSPPAEGTAPLSRAQGRERALPGGAISPVGRGARGGRPSEEGRVLAPRHDQMEKGLTRLGKVAQDKRVSVAEESDEGRETPGGERKKEGGDDSAGSTKRSSPMRESRAVEKTGGE